MSTAPPTWTNQKEDEEDEKETEGSLIDQASGKKEAKGTVLLISVKPR